MKDLSSQWEEHEGRRAALVGVRSSSPDRLASFGAPLSGWWRRVGSYLLDAVIICVPSLIFSAGVIATFGHPVTESVGGSLQQVRVLSAWAEVALVGVLVLGQALYFSLLNGSGSGQTVGNRAVGIAVRDMTTGETIGPGRGLLRWFIRLILYAVFFVPGVVNDLLPLWDGHSQTIADKVAHSVVVRVQAVRREAPGAYNA